MLKTYSFCCQLSRTVWERLLLLLFLFQFSFFQLYQLYGCQVCGEFYYQRRLRACVMLTVPGSSIPLTINFYQYIHRSSIMSISSPQRPLTQRYPKRYKKDWPPGQRKLKRHLKEVDLYNRRQTIIRLRLKLQNQFL